MLAKQYQLDRTLKKYDIGCEIMYQAPGKDDVLVIMSLLQSWEQNIPSSIKKKNVNK